jgi:hypothetical protein
MNTRKAHRVATVGGSAVKVWHAQRASVSDCDMPPDLISWGKLFAVVDRLSRRGRRALPPAYLANVPHDWAHFVREARAAGDFFDGSNVAMFNK